MAYIVVAYHTKDKFYSDHAARLIESLKLFLVPYDVTGVDSLGDWWKNTQYKPEFLKTMMSKHPDQNIVYVDVDAVFLKRPILFDEIDKIPNVQIAAHLLDHTKYRRKDRPPELLSGTLYLRNNSETLGILDRWSKQCATNPLLWDQAALSQVIGSNFYHLPDEYCVIFDYMASVQNPVIKHFQASRAGKQLFPKKR